FSLCLSYTLCLWSLCPTPLQSLPSYVIHHASQDVSNPVFVSCTIPSRRHPRTLQCLYPIPRALIGSPSLSRSFPEESPLRKHHFSHFCPAEAYFQSTVTHCDTCL